MRNFGSVQKAATAASGGAGSSHHTTGADGDDFIVRVPIGTSVKLLDKIFATKPQLKAAYMPEKLAQEGKEAPGYEAGMHIPEAPVDQEVSFDYEQLSGQFAQFRKLQKEAGFRRFRPLSLDMMAQFEPADSKAAARKQTRARIAAAVPLADLFRHGDRVTVARGGRGGLGNGRYPSRTWGPAARWSETGGAGEEASLLLELKLLADVALVGFPNAGKSSLLRVLTKARPKVAAYAFTTLQPQLGALPGRVPGEEVVVADMPGLVEGAHDDRGLGHEFLRHIERTRVLAYVIDISQDAALQPRATAAVPYTADAARALDTANSQGQDMSLALQQYQQLQQEIRDYSAAMLLKPSVVLLNKTDKVPDACARRDAFVEALDRDGAPRVLLTSAEDGSGLQEVEAILYRMCLDGDSAQS